MSLNFDEKDLKNSPKDEDDEENFIKKDDKEELAEEPKKKEPGLIWKLKNFLNPKKYQQRNLEREVGGLEVEIKKVSTKDVWDDRAVEVSRMAKNVFNSTGMRSVIWKKKLEKRNKEEALAAAAVVGAELKKGGKVSAENTTPKMGFTNMLKMRQDHSGIYHDDNSRGGGR